MAARAGDKPDIELSHEEFTRHLQESYAEGKALSDKTDEDFANMEKTNVRLSQKVKDFEKVAHEQHIDVNKLEQMYRKRGFEAGTKHGILLGIEDAVKETAFFKLEGIDNKHEPHYFDIYNINRMENWIRDYDDKEGYKYLMPTGISNVAKEHEFTRGFMRSLNDQIKDAEKNEFILMNGKKQTNFKVSFGKQIAKLLDDYGMTPQKHLPTKTYTYNPLPKKPKASPSKSKANK